MLAPNIVLLEDGDVVVAGRTNSRNLPFPPEGVVWQPASGGAYDGFVFRLRLHETLETAEQLRYSIRCPRHYAGRLSEEATHFQRYLLVARESVLV